MNGIIDMDVVIMKYKLLEEQDIDFMENVLIDDNMIYNRNSLKKFVDDKNAYGFIAKEGDVYKRQIYR